MAEPDYLTRHKTLGRNDDCTCGSKKKYKKCHLQADEQALSNNSAKLLADAKVKAEKEAKDNKGKEGHEVPEHPHRHGNLAGVPKSHAPVTAARKVTTPQKSG